MPVFDIKFEQHIKGSCQITADSEDDARRIVQTMFDDIVRFKRHPTVELKFDDDSDDQLYVTHVNNRTEAIRLGLIDE